MHTQACFSRLGNALLLAPALWALLTANWVAAQAVSGTITGRVVDPSGSAIAGAAVVLLNERTGETRRLSTNDVGSFLFAAVPPGVYTVRVEQAGFQTFERTGTTLSANERLSLGDLPMELGVVTEKVTVEASGATVQTASSEHSAQLTSSQINMILVRGRDVMSLLRLLPGVSYSIDSEAVGEGLGTHFPYIQGGRQDWNTFNVDGLAGNDLGNPWVASSSVNLDAIAEVKVLLNSFQAEYGRSGGAFINVVTKSGTREFHGTGYWYKRHEQFNANDFFNNLNNVAKPLYRHSTLGLTLGGPIYIPKKFNRDRSKLFFFYSLENWESWQPRPLQRVTVPTQLERNGDFSQTLDLGGQLIPIRDPLSGKPFPGNVVPASRLNRNGQILLNVFPQPNALDRNLTRGAYNYVFSQSWKIPKRQHLFKIDYQLSNADRISVRGSTWRADNQGYGAPAGATAAWDLLKTRYLFKDNGLVLNYTRILSPAAVNEFIGGVRHSRESAPALIQSEVDRLIRSNVGMTLGQFYPQNNPLNLIPRATFGGVPSAAPITWDGRFPMRGADTVFNFSDTLSLIHGSHTLKFGVFADRAREYEGEDGTFSGLFAFDRDVNNPLDANYAYANALLGNFASYVESTSRPGYNGRQTILQWFGQDAWKVNRRLTLEYGMRFVWYTPWTQKDGTSAAFALGRYDRAKIPQLYRPARDAAGRRGAMNPLTGELAPAALIGAYVPASGDIINGMVEGTDRTYPAGFMEQRPVQLEPRLGFAYDLFGDGKTAIRGSAGIFKNTRSRGGPPVVASKFNPPRQFNPTIFYQNMDSLLSATGVLFPSGTVYSFDKESLTPTLYSFTLGVQRHLGFGTVMGVSYVSTLTRHLLQSRNINLVPYGSRFLPEHADPTNPAVPLPDNFFRPYPGYGNITYYETSGSSNYHAMQVTVNRRYARGLEMGLSYTWSKAMNYGDADSALLATYRPHRIWNYGKAGFDQTHNFVVNYIWDVPKASRLWPNPLVRHVLDNWQIAGVTAFVSGTPLGVSFSTVDATDITGGGDGARVIVTGKAQLPRSERGFSRWFDTSVFARPPRGDFGNAPKDVFRGPGVNNWDISLFKNIPLRSEARALQLRWEMYNAFNHTQFSGVDNAARFDAQGRQVNTRFGQVISTRAPRVMQIALRFSF